MLQWMNLYLQYFIYTYYSCYKEWISSVAIVFIHTIDVIMNEYLVVTTNILDVIMNEFILTILYSYLL